MVSKIKGLKNYFLIMQIFLAFIPLSVACIMLYYFINQESKYQTERENQAYTSIRRFIENDLLNLQNKTEVLVSSNEYFEFLTSPSTIRDLLENRIYGKIAEADLASTIKYEWHIFDRKNRLIFTTDKSILNVGEFKDGYSVFEEQIIYKKTLLVDDQYLSGPNAKKNSSVIVSVPVEGFYKKYPEIKKIDDFQDHKFPASLALEFNSEVKKTNFILFVFAFAILIAIFLVFITLRFIRLNVINRITDVSSKFTNTNFKKIKTTSNDEIDLLEKLLVDYLEQIKSEEEFKIKATQVASQAKLAAQVSHDIRSPLAALNMVLMDVASLQENKRLLIRRAVNRINDIANNLLQSNSEKPNNKNAFLISSLVESVVTEKRMQYREQNNISIEHNLDNSYGHFSHVDPSMLKRIISNVINNSVEAFEHSNGRVLISVESCSDEKFPNAIEVRCCDTGKGIAADILNSVGKEGFSHGKENTESGSGLGIYQAIQYLESIGGALSISSQLNKGTVLRLIIPKSPTPGWFLSSLKISRSANVICIDDDDSIHQLWGTRMKPLGMKYYSFTSITQAILQEQALFLPKTTFLIDYEFIGQNTNGLDIIKSLKGKGCMHLVTSHYEEHDLITQCNELGIKIIPKNMAAIIPIELF